MNMTVKTGYKQWELYRKMYATVVAKVQVKFDKDKKISLEAKKLECTHFIIVKEPG